MPTPKLPIVAGLHRARRNRARPRPQLIAIEAVGEIRDGQLHIISMRQLAKPLCLRQVKGGRP